MLSLGLSAAQQQVFHNVLASSHSITIRVQVLDLAHRAVDDITDRFIGGQIDVDRMSTPSRTASLTFSDPDSSIGFDEVSPDKAALFLNRMIRVIYAVNGSGLSDWVSVPVFTGPVTGLSRNGGTLQVECSGKEVLAMGAAWNPMSFPAGEFKTFAATAILRGTGERHHDFMTLPDRLGSPVSLGPESVPWDVAWSILRGGDRQMFYDGRGVARLRRFPTSTQFTFRTGEGGTLTALPQVSYDVDEVRNAVLVKGPVPKGAKTPIRASLQAPPEHPLSPVKLGRNGARRYLLETIEDDTLRSHAEAYTLAQSRLNFLLATSAGVSADALVIPHLEPGDLIRIQTDDFAVSTRVETFTIPLVANETMSLGYQRRISVGPLVLRSWIAKPAKRVSRVLTPPRKRKKRKPRTSSKVERFR